GDRRPAPGHHRLRGLPRWRPRPRARHARALGAGGSRGTLRRDALDVRGTQATRAPCAAAVRPDPDLPGRWRRAVRIRRHRPAPRRTPSRPAACRPCRPRARHRLAVRRPVHGGTANRRARAGAVPGARPALARGEAAAAGRTHPCPPAPARRVSRRAAMAGRRVQRGRPDDGHGPAPYRRHGTARILPEPRRLRRTRQGAPGLPARLGGPARAVHAQRHRPVDDPTSPRRTTARAPPPGEDAMKIVTSLSFRGQCREAFEFYARVLGGKLTVAVPYGEMPAGDT